jgi:hypothetical protein
MQLFCQACQAAFTGLTRCPRCGALLLLPQEAGIDLTQPGQGPVVTVKPTPAGRVGVGTVVALGLYLGLRKVAAGLVVATGHDPDGWWLSADGLVAVLGLQSAAALFGALLAGAGRAKGFLPGAAVGGVCGALFLAAELIGGAPAGQLVLLLQPVILAVGGGVAGAVGTRVWAPVPELEMPPPATKKLSSIQLTPDAPANAARPTAWVRVVIGALVIMIGVSFAEPIRSGIQKASRGALRVESQGQGRFLSWQLAALAMLGGGAVAGATTGAGLRHGVLAGLFGGAAVVGSAAVHGVVSPPAAYMLDNLNFDGTNPQDPASMVALAACVLVAGLIGGWLGGTLFLPLAPEHMRTRRRNFGQDLRGIG